MTQGEIVEAGPTARDLRAAAAPVHAPPPGRRAVAARRRAADRGAGRPDGRGREGLVPGQGAACCAARWTTSRRWTASSVTVREGQTVGVVGESGSGKTTLGLALLRLLRSDGPDPVPGPGAPGPRLARAAAAPPGDADRLPGSLRLALARGMSVGQIVEEGLASTRIAASAAEREALIDEALAEVGLDPPSRRPLSARVLRRPAAARRDRPRARAEAAADRPRRADLGARPVRPGADRSTSCASCRRATGSPTSSSATTCGSSAP